MEGKFGLYLPVLILQKASQQSGSWTNNSLEQSCLLQCFYPLPQKHAAYPGHVEFLQDGYAHGSLYPVCKINKIFHRCTDYEIVWLSHAFSSREIKLSIHRADSEE